MTSEFVTQLGHWGTTLVWNQFLCSETLHFLLLAVALGSPAGTFLADWHNVKARISHDLLESEDCYHVWPRDRNPNYGMYLKKKILPFVRVLSLFELYNSNYIFNHYKMLISGSDKTKNSKSYISTLRPLNVALIHSLYTLFFARTAGRRFSVTEASQV